ncbi:MAG TPA: hypothetical protein VGC95_11325, partial [Chitinophagaceae bacterium]
VAYHGLERIFPGASISVNRSAPAYWDSLTAAKQKQALIIICPAFDATRAEMERILAFVRTGNSVLLSTASLSYAVQSMLHCEVPEVYDINSNLSMNHNSDSFAVSLASPPFTKKDEYGCPGRRFE